MVSSVVVVMVLNCVMALGVLRLACALWRWRCGLASMNAGLMPETISQSKVGYLAVQQRVQLAEARLEVAKWQLRSQQIKQLLRLIKLLRRLLLYRTMQRKGKLSIK